nr:MAG: capsid protein [Picornaviridae sp.]
MMLKCRITNTIQQILFKFEVLGFFLKNLGLDGPIVPQSSKIVKPVLGFSEQQHEVMMDMHVSERDYAERIPEARVTLNEFLSRPVLITTVTWTNSVTLNETFYPWQLYLETPAILARFQNYTNLRGTLCIKAVINGNPFLYGRVIMAYCPLHNFDQVTEEVLPTTNFGAGVFLSQYPRIFIDPTTSLAGTIKAPFFYPKEYLNITSKEWREMGRIRLFELQNLSTVTDKTDFSVDINIFAWMEDVELVSPTSVVPQSGTEYKSSAGIVSMPATAIAKTAALLTNVPTIAPYAKATQNIATGVAAIARAFGYCSELNLDKQINTLRIDPKAATVNFPSPANKIAVDMKQETTIDPQVTGVNFGDELTIHSIASRESLFSQFQWESTAISGDFLFNTAVTPSLAYRIADATNGDMLCMTSICYAAQPFYYWTGSIKFRFQIVSSNFHKGRLAIVYDPNGTTSTASGPKEYLRFTEVIDISQTRDFDVTIGMNQQTSLLKVPPACADDVLFDTDIAVAGVEGINGTLQVYVINPLVSNNSTPTEPTDIFVNVYVCAGDDFELFSPTDRSIKNFSLGVVPQSAIVPQSGANESLTQPKDLVEQTTTTQTDEAESIPLLPLSKEKNVADVYIGERVPSFRSLLKRSYYHHTDTTGATATDSISVTGLSNGMFPAHRAMFPVGTYVGMDLVNVGGSLYWVNFVSNTLLNYLTPAYAGWRGGIRWKMYYLAQGAHTALINVNRLCPRDFTGYGVEVYSLTNSDFTTARYEGPDNADYFNWNSGNTQFSNTLDPLTEIELPYYSSKRFYPARLKEWTTVNPDIDYTGWNTTVISQPGTQGTYSRLIYYVSAAEDFNLIFYLSPPVIRCGPLPRGTDPG